MLGLIRLSRIVKNTLKSYKGLIIALVSCSNCHALNLPMELRLSSMIPPTYTSITFDYPTDDSDL